MNKNLIRILYLYDERTRQNERKKFESGIFEKKCLRVGKILLWH